MDVKLVESMADDLHVVRSAKVSTEGTKSLGVEENEGLINYLMREKHASPFEHSTFTFFVTAPIFVTREMLRHRTASINEESGRYRVLEPSAYLPYHGRPLKQVGKAGHYTFEPGKELGYLVGKEFTEVYDVAWKSYERMIEAGVAREVARMILPIGIYSSLYFTVNVRALINFLYLRLPPNALWEIRYIAEKMENYFRETMPLTYKAWINNGKQAL